MFVFADIFAGCGGLSLGMLQAGAKGVFAVERHPDAFETLKHNLIRQTAGRPSFDWPTWLPVSEFDVTAFIKTYSKQLQHLRGQIDVLAGGPPCQGFSTSGLRCAADPRNQLFRRHAELVGILSPQVVLLENVAGVEYAFGDPSGGRQQTKENLRFSQQMIGAMEEKGYRVFCFKVCASSAGVPQSRTRFFLLGLRKDLAGSWYSYSAINDILTQTLTDVRTLFGLDKDGFVSAGDAISDLEIVDKTLVPSPGFPGFNQLLYLGPKTHFQRTMRVGVDDSELDSARLPRHGKIVVERFRKILERVPPGKGTPKDLLEELGTMKHRVFRMDKESPCHTLTTLPDDILHYSEPRILTVRENARLQSFPDWFHFKGPYTTGGSLRSKACPRYTQVGNAVPVRLSTFLAYSMENIIATAKAKMQKPLKQAA